MFKRLLLAAALAFACLPMTAHAQECEFPFDATLREFMAAGAPTEEIAADLLPKYIELASTMLGAPVEGVTRGFVVIVGGQILLGLEANDCLLPPLAIGKVAPAPTPEPAPAPEPEPAAGQLSGRGTNGRIGA